MSIQNSLCNAHHNPLVGGYTIQSRFRVVVVAVLGLCYAMFMVSVDLVSV